MIRVIREDGVEILLNTSVIERVEEARDRKAILILGTGEKIKVKTPAADVIQKIKAYHSGFKQEKRDYEKNLEKLEREKEKAIEKAVKEKAEKEAAKLAKAEALQQEEKEINWNVMTVEDEVKAEVPEVSEEPEPETEEPSEDEDSEEDDDIDEDEDA
ncbi:MAG: flagellar FlbD family protein [Candidatus Omnitrophota bacterium]